MARTDGLKPGTTMFRIAALEDLAEEQTRQLAVLRVRVDEARQDMGRLLAALSAHATDANHPGSNRWQL